MRTYETPVLIKREALSDITANSCVSPFLNDCD
jgi:hypothetical protein